MFLFSKLILLTFFLKKFEKVSELYFGSWALISMPVIISNIFLKILFFFFVIQLMTPEKNTPIFEFLSISANCLGMDRSSPFFFVLFYTLTLGEGNLSQNREEEHKDISS